MAPAETTEERAPRPEEEDGAAEELIPGPEKEDAACGLEEMDYEPNARMHATVVEEQTIGRSEAKKNEVQPGAPRLTKRAPGR